MSTSTEGVWLTGAGTSGAVSGSRWGASTGPGTTGEATLGRRERVPGGHPACDVRHPSVRRAVVGAAVVVPAGDRRSGAAGRRGAHGLPGCAVVDRLRDHDSG